MKAPAAKGKASQLTRSRLAHRASGPTMSYLKTRIRASRLYQAAFILAIVELTRRLHQAYRQAYDKHAADQLLPQNPQGDVDLSPAQRKVVEYINTLAKGLMNNKDCREYIQDGPESDFRITNAIERLAWLEKNRGITYFHGMEFNNGSGLAISAVRGTYTGFGRSSPRIVPGYYFFTEDVGRVTEYWRIDRDQARLLVILHELRHDVTRSPDSGPPGGAESGDGHSQAILKKCLGLVTEIPKQ